MVPVPAMQIAWFTRWKLSTDGLAVSGTPFKRGEKSLSSLVHFVSRGQQPKLKRGMRLRHSQHGEGEIEQIAGPKCVKVRFENGRGNFDRSSILPPFFVRRTRDEVEHQFKEVTQEHKFIEVPLSLPERIIHSYILRQAHKVLGDMINSTDSAKDLFDALQFALTSPMGLIMKANKDERARIMERQTERIRQVANSMGAFGAKNGDVSSCHLSIKLIGVLRRMSTCSNPTELFNLKDLRSLFEDDHFLHLCGVRCEPAPEDGWNFQLLIDSTDHVTKGVVERIVKPSTCPNGSTCVICTEHFKLDNQVISELHGCTHMFHADCIKASADSPDCPNFCPICRSTDSWSLAGHFFATTVSLTSVGSLMSLRSSSTCFDRSGALPSNTSAL